MWTSKIERARDHLKELELEISKFFNSEPYTVNTKFHAESVGMVVNKLLGRPALRLAELAV